MIHKHKKYSLITKQPFWNDDTLLSTELKKQNKI
jgi:hypothetical protein